jgi:urea transport system permease protein
MRVPTASRRSNHVAYDRIRTSLHAGLRRPEPVQRAAADGLGLAIIFGQMGVINMAHGEFMTIGAYTIYLLLVAVESYAPGSALLLPDRHHGGFCVAFAFGWLVEWALIRHLYKRPLDTLLATWGLSLIMQQIFRSTFGAKEVSPRCPTG